MEILRTLLQYKEIIILVSIGLLTLLLVGVRVIKQGERAIVLRLGRVLEKIRKPGLTFVFPGIDIILTVNLDREIPSWQSMEAFELGENIKRVLLAKKIKPHSVNDKLGYVPATLIIIKNDYWALLLAGFPLVSIILFIFGKYFGWIPEVRDYEGHFIQYLDKEGIRILFNIVLWSSLICLPFLKKRIGRIQDIFRNGIVTKGQIKSVYFDGDKGRVEYKYIFTGKEFNSGHAITLTKRTAAFSKDREITVILDPNDPSKSVLRDIYF